MLIVRILFLYYLYVELNKWPVLVAKITKLYIP